VCILRSGLWICRDVTHVVQTEDRVLCKKKKVG
jgi:hypothetical protein